MPIRVTCHSLSLAVVLVSIALSAGAQVPSPQPPRSLFDRYTEPIRLFEVGLGTFTRPISSRNREAQQFFDQGFQMMWAFAKPEAIRSFREAWKRDPECAIRTGAKPGPGGHT